MDQSVLFGVCLPLFANPGVFTFRTPCYEALDPLDSLTVARLAEDLGYDSVWVADHLMLGRDGAILEGWTTLAVVAGQTRRVRLGTIHLCNGFRSPALVAKMAATLDALSGGRLIFFFDAGWRREEFVAYGYSWEDDTVRLARLLEALEVVRRLWTGGPVSYAGQYYRLDQAVCRPQPVQRPHPPIWLGEARHPRLLEAIARYADGWNSVPASPRLYAEKLAAVRAACARLGRDPATLELSLETQVLVGADRGEVRRVMERIAALAERYGQPVPEPPEAESPWLVGTPDEVVDQLRSYTALGVRHVLLWFMDFPETAGLRLFAERVLPAFRSSVAL